MLKTLAAALSFLLLLPAGYAPASDMRVIEPRAFGYFLGDTLTRKVEIQGSEGETLVPGSLPVPGALSHWLELRKIDTSSKRNGDGVLHTVTLEYQIFYAALDTRPLVIPAIDLMLMKQGDASRTVTVPALPMTVSPLREISPGKDSSGATTLLRPDTVPAFVPVAPIKTGMLISFGAALAAFALLARQLAWWPFRHRPARAFSVAAREIAALTRSGPADHDAYDKVLTLMHRAIDQTAGRRVLPDDLDRFLEQRPQYRTSRDELGAFFDASRTVYFGGRIEEGLSRFPPEKVRALATELASQERAAA
jgi:mxaA protein